MSCDKYIKWISAALDGELTAEERRELDSHLAVCPSCAALFETLGQQSRTLRDLDAPFPAGLHDRIMNHLPPQEAPAKKSNVIRWKQWVPAVSAACLVLVIALGAFTGFGLRMGSSAPAAEAAPELAPGSPFTTASQNTKAETDDTCYSQAEAVPNESVADSVSTVSFSKVHYLRAGYGNTPEAPSAVVISNTASLDGYLAKVGSGMFTEADTPVPLPEAEHLRETYGADFFSGRSLLMVLLEEGSGSISHELYSITTDTVTIRRIVPEVGTCDMVAWLLVVELDELLDDGSTLSVTFTE